MSTIIRGGSSRARRPDRTRVRPLCAGLSVDESASCCSEMASASCSARRGRVMRQRMSSSIMWQPSIPISAAILCSAAARRRPRRWCQHDLVGVEARRFAGGLDTRIHRALHRRGPWDVARYPDRENSPSSRPARMRGTSCCRFLADRESNVLSKNSRCGVAWCVVTIARSGAVSARRDAAGADCVRTSTGRTRRAQARPAERMLYHARLLSAAARSLLFILSSPLPSGSGSPLSPRTPARTRAARGLAQSHRSGRCRARSSHRARRPPTAPARPA